MGDEIIETLVGCPVQFEAVIVEFWVWPFTYPKKNRVNWDHWTGAKNLKLACNSSE